MPIIKVEQIEFVEGGNTLWVHGMSGTVFRLKVSGQITSNACEQVDSTSHADAMAEGDIRFCLGTADSGE